MTKVTQPQLDAYKALYPENLKLQSVTIQQLLDNTKGLTGNWRDFRALPALDKSGEQLTDCQLAIGYVIFDCVSLAIGAVGLRASLNAQSARAMAAAAGPVLSQIEIIIAQIGAPGATKMQQAYGVFQILKTIYNGGSFSAVFSAFTSTLTWWQAILYGATGLATIVAALATDGLALAAEIVVLLATFGFLATDAYAAVQACTLSPPGPDPTPPLPDEPQIAFVAVGGNFITVVNNGNLGGNNTALWSTATSVGPYEKFTIVPIAQNQGTFAIQTASGQLISATNGGGMGGPNDATCPVHTDATAIGSWESLMLEQQDDGTYAIATTGGFYLTAVNGGGLQDQSQPIQTCVTVAGPWETFTMQTLPPPPQSSASQKAAPATVA